MTFARAKRSTTREPLSETRPKPVSPGRASERQVVGSYTLQRLLGSGAMGEVWLARHLVTDGVAAVKLLHEHVATREKGTALLRA